MENKIKHRILGAAVILGLVVILFPFFQTRNDLPSEPILVKAPPFPDQAIQVTAADPEEKNTEKKDISNLNSKQEPKNLIHSIQPSIVSNEKVLQKLDDKLIATVDEAQIQYSPNVRLETNGAINKKLLTLKKPILAHASNSPNKRLSSSHPYDDHPVRANLKNAAWVIQAGSFKDKKNALRIVNKLRENGYKAFIEQTATVSGNHTRVFVGPLDKQAAAHELANQIEQKFNIHGMIISYKPLAL